MNSTFRHTLVLLTFALLSAFSGAAVSGSVHKCLQANGQYEFTDLKCVTPTPAAAPTPEKSAAVVNSQNSEVKHTDLTHAEANTQPHEASPARTPVEATPKQAPLSNGNAAPSAPLKSGTPTT